MQKKKKTRQSKKVNLKEFKIVRIFHPQEIEEEKNRFKRLAKLIFPNLSSSTT